MASVSIKTLHFIICSKTPPSNHTKALFSLPTSSSSRIPLSITRNNKKKVEFLLQRARASSTDGVDLADGDDNPEGIISGEWSQNFSLLSYDDLRAYLEPEIFKDKMQPSALLGEVMSTLIRTVTVDQTLEEIDHHFEVVSGLPVINEELVCIGVVSKKDKQEASNGLKSKVGEIMSSPAITLSPDKTVLDAAALMLKMKIHRIPIVNEGGQVVGIVTRTDIFKALEGLPA
ncbi:uncharacterized protein LOC131245684 [Magnolia sinica]|uniref:uncharacterized protein LOC131245684 n=1 Tax=Magnolia sinica TaxID=86752 RepID=UPI002659E11E|nr:uncharacterized protein LOC131245684 [Magnolia sinica]